MMGTLRRYLMAGLLVWVPLGVTLLIVAFLVDLMDQTLLLLPEVIQPENLLGFRIPGLGLVLTAIVVLVTGMVVTNLFGKQLFTIGERILQRIPLVRSIYASVKQVAESMFSSGKSFRKVVLVEYPRQGMWSLAFQTGTGASEISSKTGQEIVNIFIPTTPNPTSGFFLMVPRDDVIELDMSVDQGLKMLLSVGVVVPDNKKDEIIDQHARRIS
ncbi:MAG: hypothetical protein A3E57_04785 [Candidatus Muproteobacteria bacterium RIFCSPHIGHO2_12_FULL_60_33]|uniref:Transmembrane protein n=2 Tax=Pseudomonadota TaxID=1224 RepID=A0A0H4T0Z5_9PROT|nr:hypothetical protein [uncultured proteobacterium Rifle_16ft_4_minimus_1560]OGI51403.1 MAG: hypothetical protein A3A87_05950 [Candidatus Muproteobacteria bacterium RIFCSPLOWO2_01_FULL_60_18]OGI52151.1 MAG: hypothetical protein A2W42_07080 [Candidatus Muproteobacteria bacterium RIFCSPHIGHO2_01_60_12]OGI53430.1 MAG: hypothetical protein A3E57_04785 [Candidatus Muproteobacteria bacterium RIFCSPHIGHO2_12_FULL_60_33]OGI56830.1 MAG: hypothetical protein A3D32_02490 [Candidatus Muproteobacteria bact